MQEKTEQLLIATVGFFWAFLMWFSTAAFSTSISSAFTLTTGGLALLASSALWLAPPGRVAAGWAADRFGAHNIFAFILAYSGLMSVASAFAVNYDVLFVERLIVASAGISFVVGIQHVSQWFESHEIGTAEGIYAGTGNAGAGVGALVLPRLYGTNFDQAFLHLGIVALGIAAVYKWRGKAAKDRATAETARANSNLKSTLYVWTRFAAIGLMLAYAMSFGLEIAMNSWLPTYYATGFGDAIGDLGFTSVAAIQTAAGTFAAVQSFNASLFRPFSGYMSDLWQRKGWTPYPFLSAEQGYAPRVHWLFTALCLIIASLCALSVAGYLGVLPLSVVILAGFGICVSFGTGGVFAIVPVMFEERPGVAAGFVGGVSTAGGIVYPLAFGWVPNIHSGYALVAIALFVPFTLFFVWVMRSDRSLAQYGIGSRERWLGPEPEAAPGGDD
ncbi:NNP family nitrate/nitrite transporter-like MFS transporter [Halarchaeum rubridurum]|uniref:NNP family nitrate/nitrite transporter-like MFS transporter n=1 Tax=Halarchaeum rubridurum TaxID=489911 RepID=A0A830FYE4_9EURY|nr:MFS transporter [Halarchaeum rubridurum]MBP1954828.1 NNP family nitrate/nitrite transporter-like MFS transporter [Halarchaeum rubridurum]GGM60065.1 putative nitrate/nitrite transporter NarK2 [Halarchaeum rubridurum]